MLQAAVVENSQVVVGDDRSPTLTSVASATVQFVGHMFECAPAAVAPVHTVPETISTLFSVNFIGFCSAVLNAVGLCVVKITESIVLYHGLGMLVAHPAG